MATGEIAGTPAEAQRDLDVGEATMATGRVSIARRVEPERPRLPFSPGQLARLDEALTLSTRTTGLEFSIYLGEFAEETREWVEELHGTLRDRASEVVHIALSPVQRREESVTGEEEYRRLPDRSCKLAVMSMVASFKEGELIEGLISGLRMLSDAAGTHFTSSQSGH